MGVPIRILLTSKILSQVEDNLGSLIVPLTGPWRRAFSVEAV